MILSSSLITAQEKNQMQCKENSDLSILGVEGKPQVNLVIAYKYSYKKTAAISLFSWERWEQKKKKPNQFQLQAYEHISIAFSYQHFVNLSAYLRDSSEMGWQERFGPGKVLTDNRQQRKWSSSGKNSSIFCSRNLIDFALGR